MKKEVWLCLSLLVTMIVPLSFIDTFKAQTATAQECDPNSVQLAKGSKGPKVIELQTAPNYLRTG